MSLRYVAMLQVSLVGRGIGLIFARLFFPRLSHSIVEVTLGRNWTRRGVMCQELSPWWRRVSGLCGVGCLASRELSSELILISPSSFDKTANRGSNLTRWVGGRGSSVVLQLSRIFCNHY